MATIRTKAVALAKAPVLSHLNFDNAKTILFFYVLLTQSVKAQRHLRARGIVTSTRELYTWIAQVCYSISSTHRLLLYRHRHPAGHPPVAAHSCHITEGRSPDEQGQTRYREQLGAQGRRCRATPLAAGARTDTRVDSGADGQYGRRTRE